LVFEINVNRAILAWIEGDLVACEKALMEAENMAAGSGGSMFNLHEQIYLKYIRELVTAVNGPGKEKPAASDVRLRVLGDSHCLAMKGIETSGAAEERAGISVHLRMGIKAWHLACPQENRFKRSLRTFAAGLSPDQKCLLMIGEIDCRPGTGLMGDPGMSENDFLVKLRATVNGFTAFVASVLGEKITNAHFVSVPPPSREYLQKAGHDEKVLARLALMIRVYNQELEKFTVANGAGFIDVYSANTGIDGVAGADIHLDGVHLKPEIYAPVVAPLLSIP